jgi:hypothetical protein
MPHFEEYYAGKLRGARGIADAEAELDLRAASREQAAESLRELLERSRFADARSVAIRLAPPPEGGGETLFQPVGKALLEARRAGWIAELHTLPAEDGLGFYVVLAGSSGEAG